VVKLILADKSEISEVRNLEITNIVKSNHNLHIYNSRVKKKFKNCVKNSNFKNNAFNNLNKVQISQCNMSLEPTLSQL
jgi:hypothetical protein